jgi:hypothetical protein
MEEHRLTMSENRVKRIFGCKREEVKGGMKMRWVGHVA